MHPPIIIGTVRSLWTWLWGRYHLPQNVFLVVQKFDLITYPLVQSCQENSLLDLLSNPAQQESSTHHASKYCDLSSVV